MTSPYHIGRLMKCVHVHITHITWSLVSKMIIFFMSKMVSSNFNMVNPMVLMTIISFSFYLLVNNNNVIVVYIFIRFCFPLVEYQTQHTLLDCDILFSYRADLHIIDCFIKLFFKVNPYLFTDHQTRCCRNLSILAS